MVGSPALMRWGGRWSQWIAPSLDLRVLEQFRWLEAGSVTMALSRPTLGALRGRKPLGGFAPNQVQSKVAPW